MNSLALALAGVALAQPIPEGGILGTELFTQPSNPPGDLRFFGTYCLPAPKKLCPATRARTPAGFGISTWPLTDRRPGD